MATPGGPSGVACRRGDRSSATALEQTLRREGRIVAAGLALVCALAWLDLLRMAASMGMPASLDEAVAMTGMRPWDPTQAALVAWMWIVMMVAMMLPSAAPMILLFARVGRSARAAGRPFAPTGAFAAGYLLAWTGFSLAATAAQWGLERAALLSPEMAATSPLLGGLVMLAAGLYQWTPWKDACLRQCRSPAHFLSQHWRPGTRGALRMGIEHGGFCVGCCAVLMVLLFVGGVMNLIWVAAIAVFVLLEKVVPHGARAGRLCGGALALAGAAMVVAAVR